MRFQARLMVIALAMPTAFVGVDRAEPQWWVTGMFGLCAGHE
jgi:hypothetical protein